MIHTLQAALFTVFVWAVCKPPRGSRLRVSFAYADPWVALLAVDAAPWSFAEAMGARDG